MGRILRLISDVNSTENPVKEEKNSDNFENGYIFQNRVDHKGNRLLYVREAIIRDARMEMILSILSK